MNNDAGQGGNLAATTQPHGFRITSGKGFHITFANGYTVSVQFGGGNYCANRNDPITAPRDAWEASGKKGSPDAEVAVWGPDDVMLDWQGKWGDTVKGWQSPDDVLELMNWAASQPALTPSGGPTK